MLNLNINFNYFLVILIFFFIQPKYIYQYIAVHRITQTRCVKENQMVKMLKGKTRATTLTRRTSCQDTMMCPALHRTRSVQSLRSMYLCHPRVTWPKWSLALSWDTQSATSRLLCRSWGPTLGRTTYLRSVYPSFICLSHRQTKTSKII